ncbi:hypothetical protein [uncultured Shewanella sp.]|uniref:hypothetical protein n=1 Tax=uncultured Shewanella sp. TaxID=173975 RepID=UPI0026390850|nr:hypothetical protein [uncultured Shewanella sp.]
MNDDEARAEVINLINPYLVGNDPEADNLVLLLQNKDRQIPIRGVLEHLRKYNSMPYTVQEQKIIDELLYLYG